MKQASFLSTIAAEAKKMTGVFFPYPGTKMEVEVIPIDTIERRRIFDQCQNKIKIPGFRDQDNLDIDRHDQMIAEQGIGEIRGATVGCMKKIMLIDPAALEAALREKLALSADAEIRDDMEVPLGKADAMYLFANVPKFKLWVDHCQGSTEIYNEAQKRAKLGN